MIGLCKFHNLSSVTKSTTGLNHSFFSEKARACGRMIESLNSAFASVMQDLRCIVPDQTVSPGYAPGWTASSSAAASVGGALRYFNVT